MATYDELFEIFTDTVPGAQTLRQRVQIACGVVSALIIEGNDDGPPFEQTGSAHMARVRWAERFLTTPAETARQMFYVVIAKHAGADQAVILGADDATIQTAVNSSIDPLASVLDEGTGGV